MAEAKSSLGRLILLKVCFPALVFWIAALTLTSGPLLGSLLLVLPFVLWGTFNLTIAQVRADEHGVRYRRFWRWKEVPYSDIVRCRFSLFPPGLPYLKRRRFTPPWGSIYFAHDRGILEWPPFSWRTPLIDLNKRALKWRSGA